MKKKKKSWLVKFSIFAFIFISLSFFTRVIADSLEATIKFFLCVVISWNDWMLIERQNFILHGMATFKNKFHDNDTKKQLNQVNYIKMQLSQFIVNFIARCLFTISVIARWLRFMEIEGESSFYFGVIDNNQIVKLSIFFI